jgi:ketosteroid isomerase-like protein
VTNPETEVREAATALVAAFGAHDVTGYFGAFAPDATFLFYNAPSLIDSRAAYEAEWRSWEADGFHVQECRSLDGRIQLVTSDVAVFTHRVRTRVRNADGEHELAERETIVFRRNADGRWLGVHEHLSAEP